ncbi:MAG TPA: type II toxin-antitoxin system prevent-host-death family antitoxin [Firmicutes bacterium]|nr:type II toxin-antitoxin system prevent-host-death family antitoxin [Bacillota bacterium]
MRYANIRELKLDTNRVLEQSEKYGSVIVTRNGKPVALIRPITEDDIELKTKPLWPALRAGAQRAGYGLKDVNKIIKSVRQKKK